MQKEHSGDTLVPNEDFKHIIEYMSELPGIVK